MGRTQALSKTPNWLINCIFEGFEAEIPLLHGRKTLFIAKQKFDSDKVAHYFNYHKFYALYLGAGNNDNLSILESKKLIKKLFKKLLYLNCVFETSDYEKAIKFAEWARTVYDKKTDNYLEENLYIVIRVFDPSKIDWMKIRMISDEIMLYLKLQTANAAVLIDVHDHENFTYFDETEYQSDKIIEEL